MCITVLVPYDVISSEDMLSRVENFNEEAKKVVKERRCKRGMKLACRSCGDDWTEIVKTCIKYEMHEYDTPSEKEITCKDAKASGEVLSEINEDVDEGYNNEMDDWKAPNDEEEIVEMEKMMRCTKYCQRIRNKLLTDRPDCGVEWAKDDYELCLVGNEMVALFPSLNSKRSGEIVREETEMFLIKIPNFNYKLGSRYIKMNEQYSGNLATLSSVRRTR